MSRVYSCIQEGRRLFGHTRISLWEHKQVRKFFLININVSHANGYIYWHIYNLAGRSWKLTASLENEHLVDLRSKFSDRRQSQDGRVGGHAVHVSSQLAKPWFPGRGWGLSPCGVSTKFYHWTNKRTSDTGTLISVTSSRGPPLGTETGSIQFLANFSAGRLRPKNSQDRSTVPFINKNETPFLQRNVYRRMSKVKTYKTKQTK